MATSNREKYLKPKDRKVRSAPSMQVKLELESPGAESQDENLLPHLRHWNVIFDQQKYFGSL